jgi:hypothetical protein
MPLTEDEIYLAENCYGYGNWKAKYWFIGLEERLSPRDNGDRTNRANAFRKLNKDGLCDLVDFHKEIGEDQWITKVQPTWGRLIWLLKNYLKDDIGHCSLLRYQTLHWGRTNGDTCITELSGLPADSTARGKSLDSERFKDCKDRFDELRTNRIKILHDKIQKHNPELVIFYGKTQEQHWGKIAGCDLVFRHNVKLNLKTRFFAPHPNARVVAGEWKEMGRKLAETNRA